MKRQHCLRPTTQQWSDAVRVSASGHCTYRREWFSEYRLKRDGSTVHLGDDGECAIVGEGTIPAVDLVNGHWQRIRLENVWHIPDLKKNLLSVGQCQSRGIDVLFTRDIVKMSVNGNTIAFGTRQSNKICRMFIKVYVERPEVNVCASLRTWNERLGHINLRTVSKVVSNKIVNGAELSDKSKFFCEACQYGKSHKLPFEKTPDRGQEPGEFIHSDVCGPFSVESLGGSRYYVLYKDDASSYRVVDFIKHKSDVPDSFKKFEKSVRNKFGKPMKIFRSDNGGEYKNKVLVDYFNSLGIEFQTSAPYTQKQNGKAWRGRTALYSI